MKIKIAIPKNKITPRIIPMGGFIGDKDDENIVKPIPVRMPDIGMTPEEFTDPEYGLEVVSRLTKMLRKIIIGMLDDQLVELTEKNKNAFTFLLSIIEKFSINQFKVYNTVSEADQLSILKEVRDVELYIVYDIDIDTSMVIYKLIKIINANSGDKDGK